MWREVERFEALGTSGRTYIVVVSQHLVEFRPLSGVAQHAEGMKDAKLADGRDVTPVDDDGTFEIVVTGEVIRRIKN